METFEMPMVWETLAAGLGVRGVVTPCVQAVADRRITAKNAETDLIVKILFIIQILVISLMISNSSGVSKNAINIACCKINIDEQRV